MFARVAAAMVLLLAVVGFGLGVSALVAGLLVVLSALLKGAGV